MGMEALSFTEYGSSGPPVVVLHGLFGSARNWAGIARRLATTHRVFALDSRNHGGSPWAATMSYGEMAGDVADFIEAQNLGAPALIGHSMGGKTAMQLALQRPELVGGLMVVDIAPVTYGHDMLDYVAAMQALDLSGTERRAELEETLARQVNDTGITSFLMTNLERANDAFRWRVNLAAVAAGMGDLTSFDAPDDAVYDGPCLFIAGDRSGYIRPEHKTQISALFPASRTVTIKDADHWVHADQPENFLRTAETFLSAL